MRTYSGQGEYVELNTGQRKRSNKLKAVLIGILIAFVVATLIAVIVLMAKKEKEEEQPIPVPPVKNLGDYITIANLMKHLEELDNIAKGNSGSRAVEYGYNASVAYVLSQLQTNKDLEYRVQYFPVEVTKTMEQATFKQLEPEQVNYVRNTDFLNMGGYNGMIRLPANISNVAVLGCNDANYASFTPGNIALVCRGECDFRTKVLQAAKFGARGILIYNDGTSSDRRGVFSGSLGGSVPIPVFSLSYVLGTSLKALADEANITVEMYSHVLVYNVTTMNIIAETKKGRADRIIVVGSHLDSVTAGAGINDNGSGSSLNLELALQLTKTSLNIVNKVRFCWWGAEEIGLLGSKFYVNDLKQNNPNELKNIALNLNFDMVGSPNFFYGIYNGSGAPLDIVNASRAIQRSFEDFLTSINRSFVLTEFNGRSDYGPFIENGVPAGGLFTGAEGIKSVSQRAIFGGLANAAYDPCYHQACDDKFNIHLQAYTEMSQAAAYVVQKYVIAANLDALLK